MYRSNLAHKKLCKCTLQNCNSWYIPGSLKRPTEALDEYLDQRLSKAQEGQDILHLTMSYLREPSQLEIPLELLELQDPMKLYICRASKLCCGWCTNKCSSRCPQDLLQRLAFLAMDGNREVQEALGSCCNQPPAQSNPKHKSTYEHLCWLLNKSLAEMSIEQSIGAHYDYSEKIKLDPNTGKPITDPVTNLKETVRWPASGMCPFCISADSIKSRRGSRNTREPRT